MSSTPTSKKLTHFDGSGQAHMVDISEKQITHRTAIAQGFISMQENTLQTIMAGDAKKGDVLGIARIAAIQAAKKTADLIPLCHPISLTKVSVEFEIQAEENKVICTVFTQCDGKTGVEMEALSAVSGGLLTIYDMCKAIDRGMVIGAVKLLEKHGGQSGDWVAQ